MKLLARYPNNTKLLDSEKADNKGNTKLLAYEDGTLLTKTKIAGAVYINNTTFEVYSGIYPKQKTGIFIIGQGFDWKAQTPRQKYNIAYKKFQNEVKLKTDELGEDCYCHYPRLIDYISNRHSDDSHILKGILQNRYLKIKSDSYNQNTDTMTAQMSCKICSSEFEWKYKERGIDNIRIASNKTIVRIGAKPFHIAPNYLTAFFNKVFCRKSYIHRYNLEAADLTTMINYLFKRK